MKGSWRNFGLCYDSPGSTFQRHSVLSILLLPLSLTLLMRNYAQLLSVRHQWTLTSLWSYDFVLLYPWQSNWPFFIWKSKHESEWTVVVRIERKEKTGRKKEKEQTNQDTEINIEICKGIVNSYTVILDCWRQYSITCFTLSLSFSFVIFSVTLFPLCSFFPFFLFFVCYWLVGQYFLSCTHWISIHVCTPIERVRDNKQIIIRNFLKNNLMNIWLEFTGRFTGSVLSDQNRMTPKAWIYVE